MGRVKYVNTDGTGEYFKFCKRGTPSVRNVRTIISTTDSLNKTDVNRQFDREHTELHNTAMSRFLLKDVYWQNSMSVGKIDIEDEFLLADHVIQSSCDTIKSIRISENDNNSETSEDSSNSADIRCTYGKNKIEPRRCEYRRKAKISPVFTSDPYLETYRLKLNQRQKNRMNNLNTMFRLLDTVIPSEVKCKLNVKSHSKLGILKRAIEYLNEFIRIDEHIETEKNENHNTEG